MKRFALLIFGLLNLNCFSQTFLNGTQFTMTIVSSGEIDRICICTSINAQIILTSIAGIDTIILAANSCDTIENGENTLHCQINDSAVHIESDQPINVYSLREGQNPEATLIFPVTDAGTDFYTTHYPYLYMDSWGGVSALRTLFSIITMEDSSHIEIIPTDSMRCFSTYYQPYVPIDLWMDKGQHTWMGNYHPAFPSNTRTLNGTLIHSLPVNGHKAKFQVTSERDGAAASTPRDAILPVSLWGKHNHAVPNLTRHGTLYKIISAYDSTVITIDGSAAFNLNTGGTADTLLFNPAMLSANNPFSCVQVSRDRGEDSVARSDAFTYQLLDDSQIITHSVFPSHFYGVAAGIIDTELVCVITKTAFANIVVLDSANISSYFIPFPTDSNYSYAQVSVAIGQTHILDCDSGCIVYMYGWGYHAGYGHIIGGVNELITGVKEVAGGSGQLSVYPNPVKDVCTVTANIFNATLTLYDITGRAMLQQVFNNKAAVNVSRLAKGVYIVGVKDKEGRSVKGKLVKE